MEISKLKKFLKVYLDSVITPKVNRHFASQEGYEPVTISLYDIKPKKEDIYGVKARKDARYERKKNKNK